jgi:hypothetical protein
MLVFAIALLPAIPYSNSMILSDDKALIYQRNFFAARQRTDSPIHHFSNTNFDDPHFLGLFR